ncbi:hypothetical protein AtNW77_Chr5g0088821 [Arabidopsis thaliana]
MKEVRQLFTPFGQIKSVGLPERTKGRYAACSSLTSLNASSTRYLPSLQVIEWKKVDNSMKAIRYRSAAKYVDQENNNPKKRKSSTVVG